MAFSGSQEGKFPDDDKSVSQALGAIAASGLGYL
jgi:hypothetical protein